MKCMRLGGDGDGEKSTMSLKMKFRQLFVAEKPKVAERNVVILQDEKHSYKFAHETGKERRRAERMFVKEKGTISWLDREIRPDDVFFDIGANIGVYTIFGASRIGSQGSVYAFEPHIPNAASLIQNIMLNGLQERIKLVTSALTNGQRFDNFNYQSLTGASSTSQFGRSEYEGESFVPVFVEIKHGCAIDFLIATGAIPYPDVIKIDVDGLDFEVLDGMRELLRSFKPPRSIQVELGSDSKKPILDILGSSGYSLVEKHWSKAGLDFIDAGGDAEDYPHYGIFCKNAK